MHAMDLISFSKQEKRVNEIVLKAMGQAISKTVAIAEIIKVGLFLAFLYPLCPVCRQS
jgi:DNA-binding protein